MQDCALLQPFWQPKGQDIEKLEHKIQPSPCVWILNKAEENRDTLQYNEDPLLEKVSFSADA